MQPIESVLPDKAVAQVPASLPRVSIIVLNWNSYDVTAECLLSLRKLEYANTEVVLVDNGSRDSSAEQIQQNFPEVRLIRNAENLGFPGGNNVGIRDVLERGTDYLLLLNNDTVVAPDFLRELLRVAENDPRVGILNPKIYFVEPADRLWHGGARYKPWWSFPKIAGLNKRDDGSYNRTEEVPFITGCAFLIKSEVVKKIGLLDEMFFLGFEDLDWSLRAIAAGYKAMFVPGAVIWHKSAHDTKKNLGKPVKDFYYVRNSVLVARKHMPRRYWPLFLLSLGRYVGYRTVGYLLRMEPRRVSALYKGFWSGCSTSIDTMPTSTTSSAQVPE
jgi:GT2 family glycosyltransferase